jgi:hypothetical protein
MLFPDALFPLRRLELVGAGGADVAGIRWAVRYVPYKDPPSHVAYFHATYRDHPSPEPGKDLLLLDTRETEGGGIGPAIWWAPRGSFRIART